MAKKNTNTGKKLFDSLDAVPSMPEGYYSGDQPNPNLRKFVEEHATPYDPSSDKYSPSEHVPAITTDRSTPLFLMHSYWSKKPHGTVPK